MADWTVERVVSLAPDAASASAGQGLASLKKWTGVGRSERALWGLCQGSGKDPYQARVDLSEPAFKCSCPSRKFPCKHGLGLMLLFAKDAATFKIGSEPGWVADWLATRSEKAEKKAEKAQAAADKPVDVEAQARRAAQREARVTDGVASCRVWLDDVVKRGLAAAQVEDSSSWERTAARMVDAQAPGLAGMVRRIPAMIASGPGWEVRTLAFLGRIHLLLCAAEQLAALPPDLAGDVRVALGWNQPKEEVLAGPRVKDRWATVAQIVEDEERLKVRRTWLVGKATGQRALILDFAAGLAPLVASLVAGFEFDGEVAFYPGRAPLRALIAERGEARALATELGTAADASIEAGLRRFAVCLAANPWTARWPMALAGVRLIQDGGAGGPWCLADSDGAALPLRPSFCGGLGLWKLLSVSGGGPMTVLAEWDGEYAQPLSALTGDAYHDVAPRWAA